MTEGKQEPSLKNGEKEIRQIKLVKQLSRLIKKFHEAVYSALASGNIKPESTRRIETVECQFSVEGVLSYENTFFLIRRFDVLQRN